MIAGAVGSVPGILSVLAGGFLTDWAARRDKRAYAWIPGLGMVLAAPLYVLSFTSSIWIGATAFMMLKGLVQYAYIPAVAGVVQNMMQPRMRTSAATLTGVVFNLLGLGLGPLIVGMLSVAFGHAMAIGTCSNDCGNLTARGLRYALILTALLYLWGAVYLDLAARTIRRDLATDD